MERRRAHQDQDTPHSEKNKKQNRTQFPNNPSQHPSGLPIFAAPFNTLVVAVGVVTVAGVAVDPAAGIVAADAEPALVDADPEALGLVLPFAPVVAAGAPLNTEAAATCFP